MTAEIQNRFTRELRELAQISEQIDTRIYWTLSVERSAFGVCFDYATGRWAFLVKELGMKVPK